MRVGLVVAAATFLLNGIPADAFSDQLASTSASAIDEQARPTPHLMLRRRLGLLIAGAALVGVGAVLTGIGVAPFADCPPGSLGDAEACPEHSYEVAECPGCAPQAFNSLVAITTLSIGPAAVLSGAILLALGLERRPTIPAASAARLTEHELAIERAQARGTLIAGGVGAVISAATLTAGVTLFADTKSAYPVCSVTCSDPPCVATCNGPAPERRAGIALTTIGAVAFVPSIAVFFAGLSWRAKLDGIANERATRTTAPVIVPWLAREGAGISVSGRFE